MTHGDMPKFMRRFFVVRVPGGNPYVARVRQRFAIQWRRASSSWTGGPLSRVRAPDVLGQLLDGVLSISDCPPDEVAHRDDSLETTLPEHGQVSYALARHDRHGLHRGYVGCGANDAAGHDVANMHERGIEPAQDDSLHQVAFREHACDAFAPHDNQRAHVNGAHYFRGFEHCGLRRYAEDASTLVVENAFDGIHGAAPLGRHGTDGVIPASFGPRAAPSGYACFGGPNAEAGAESTPTCVAASSLHPCPLSSVESLHSPETPLQEGAVPCPSRPPRP